MGLYDGVLEPLAHKSHTNIKINAFKNLLFYYFIQVFYHFRIFQHIKSLKYINFFERCHQH
jgi:hypothetical protein